MQLLKSKNLVIYLALLSFVLTLLFQKADHPNRTQMLLGMCTSFLIIGIVYRFVFSRIEKEKSLVNR